MPRFCKLLISALLLFSLTMQGIFLPVLGTSPLTKVPNPDNIASLFDMTKHDLKNNQHSKRFSNADGLEDTQSEDENVAWQLDFCGSSYPPLALKSGSALFPAESIYRPISSLSKIFRPPRA